MGSTAAPRLSGGQPTGPLRHVDRKRTFGPRIAWRVDPLRDSISGRPMERSSTQIRVRRPWGRGQTIFLLGPGGVGKSSLGLALRDRLGWPLVDLDLEFCERCGLIGTFIADHGYERYRQENLDLAKRLVKAIEGETIFVTASGFLAAPVESDDYREARRTISGGYGITLLPTLDLEIAVSIVVGRQLNRGFGLERASEDRKFRERFLKYFGEGQALVVSMESPAQIADTIVRDLLRN